MKRTSLFSFGVALAFSALSANAADYAPGFTWDRSVEWSTDGLVVGSTQGNAMPDSQGSPVWSLEWTSGLGLESASPWYEQESHLMIWDLWSPPHAREHYTWVRVNDSEPKITQYGISNSRSLNWGSWDYQAMVRWVNPTGHAISTSIIGRLQLEWGAGSGYMISPDADVDVVMIKYDASADRYVPIFSETIANPEAGKPYPPTTIDVPVSFSDVVFGAGDSLIISLRATTAPSVYDSWVILRDHIKITYVSSVPEPQSGLLFLAGLPFLLAAGATRRTCR